MDKGKRKQPGRRLVFRRVSIGPTLSLAVRLASEAGLREALSGEASGEMLTG